MILCNFFCVHIGIDLSRLVGQNIFAKIMDIIDLTSFRIQIGCCDSNLISAYTQHKQASANLLTAFKRHYGENQCLPVRIDSVTVDNK